MTHDNIYDGDMILCEFYSETKLVFIYDKNRAEIAIYRRMGRCNIRNQNNAVHEAHDTKTGKVEG